MRLSALQRFTLIQCYAQRKARISRKIVNAFYKKSEHSPIDVEDVVTKSLERLIDKGLVVGFGRRTPKKWFIDEIRLTPQGRRVGRKLLGEQLTLPLRAHRRTKQVP